MSDEQVEKFAELLTVFSATFEDPQTYGDKDLTHLKDFLSDSCHVVIVARDDEGKVLGGLVAYVLQKFEKPRKELFIYDLAVASAHQRKGVATSLIKKAQEVGRESGCYTMFVEADDEDQHAIEFYRSLKPTEELQAHHYSFEL